MGKPIEQGCCHFGVAENVSPLAEAQVGGDHHAGALVELDEQLEQQCPARRAERQVALPHVNCYLPGSLPQVVCYRAIGVQEATDGTADQHGRTH